MKLVPVFLLLTLFAGCIAGGIGQRHDPAQNILFDDAYTISMELTAPGGNAKKAFDSAAIIVADQEPREMKIDSATKEKVVFVASILVEELPSGSFSYYFTY